MASVKGPLLSMDASGSVASTITFAKWKGRNYVRELVKPSNPKTAGQVAVRAVLKFVTQTWASLSTVIKTRWADVAASDSITALNAMVRRNGSRGRAGLGMLQDPTLAAGAVEAAPAAPGAAAGYKSLSITWTDSTGADDWATTIWGSTTAGFVAGPTNIIAVVKRGVQLFEYIGLVSGTLYSFKAGGSEKGGTLGTKSAQFQGTPT